MIAVKTVALGKVGAINQIRNMILKIKYLQIGLLLYYIQIMHPQNNVIHWHQLNLFSLMLKE